MKFNPQENCRYPKSDRFYFLRLVKFIRDLAFKRGDQRLTHSTNECLSRLTHSTESCPMSRLFSADYLETGLPPSLAFSREERLECKAFSPPHQLVYGLLEQVKRQAETAADEPYLEAVRGCERLIATRNGGCPFHWIPSTKDLGNHR